MAASLDACYACHPSTERGRGVLLGGCKKTNSVVYCNGKAVILRSLDNPSQAEVYTEHAYHTTVARVSPNGEWVASADASGSVRVWARGGDRVLRLETKPISGSIDDLQWSNDGQRIVVSGDGKTSRVKAFSWDTGVQIGEFEGHSKRVNSCDFRPCRPFRIMTGGEDFTVNFYEGPPFRFKSVHKEHSNFVNCVRYSPDGSLLVSVGSDKKGFLFKGATGEKVGELSSKGGHTGSIYAASWSPDGKQLLTVSADKSAKIWDVAADGGSAELNTTFTFGKAIGDMQVGCLWLGPHIVTLSLSGNINFLSPSLPSPSRVLHGHTKEITAVVAVSSSGIGADGDDAEQIIFTGSYDGLLVKWQRAKGGAVGSLQAPGGFSIKAMDQGGGQLKIAGLDDTLHSVPTSASDLSSESRITIGAQPHDVSIAAKQPSSIAVATAKGVALFNEASLLSLTPLPSSSCLSVGFSPDGSELAVGAANGSVFVFEVKGDSLSQAALLQRHQGQVTAVGFSPDGSMLATCDSEREVVVWDAVTREIKVKNMVYHTARVNCFVWSPSSARIATGSLDTNIIIYTIEKPLSARITIQKTHMGGVTGLVFLDENTLLSVGNDACLRVWKLPPLA